MVAKEARIRCVSVASIRTLLIRLRLQDFERKSALFSLASSEVMIVNIWEHQVGLYQGQSPHTYPYHPPFTYQSRRKYGPPQDRLRGQPLALWQEQRL
jgi:hypothetical protein